jgi:putative Mg2+ transporter-C (MgtC) family protein
MPITLTWEQIAVRLALSAIAAALIGMNRGEHGSPAGLRTNLLVSLAACIAMIQANLLMNSVGKAPDSFVVLDLMRLPLGILSGMGFIGAGAILRKDNRISGVTTAATLWFVTVMGLCFGGGQLGLGGAALGLALIVLWAMKWIERKLPQTHYGSLVLVLNKNIPVEEEMRKSLRKEGYKLLSCGKAYTEHAEIRELRCQLSWEAPKEQLVQPGFIEALAHHPDVLRLEWTPEKT